jgi:hypothetical protein
LQCAKRKYKDAGYKLPHIVFWNVAGSYDNSPAKHDEENVSLISGFSQSLLSLFNGQDPVTPYETLRKAIDDECFARIEAPVSKK